MATKTRFVILAAGMLATTLAIAQPTKEAKQPEGGMPAMTPEQMQACMESATPGAMHEKLAKQVGTWEGKVRLYMPGMEPTDSTCTTVISSMLDGRFNKIETAGEMPGMGPFNGFGITGFDNVSQKFQSTWIDNCGTGMMTGTGELTSDGKTMNWAFSFNCPITKGPMKVRQVENYTGPNSMDMTMFGTDPASGKEYKMMEIKYTRKGEAAEAAKPAATARSNSAK